MERDNAPNARPLEKLKVFVKTLFTEPGQAILRHTFLQVKFKNPTIASF